MQLARLLWESSGDAVPAHDNGEKPENKLPENPDVLELCKFLQKKLTQHGTMIGCAKAFCAKNGIDEAGAENLLRQAKRFRHLWET